MAYNNLHSTTVHAVIATASRQDGVVRCDMYHVVHT
jgi:hypothetical protein